MKINKKLLQRVEDVFAGVLGHKFVEDDDLMCAKELALVTTALSSLFDPENEAPERFGKWSIEEFETPVKATEHIQYVLEHLKWKHEQSG